MAIPRYHDERLGGLPERFFSALGHLQYAYTSLEVQMACTVSQFITMGYDSAAHFPLIDKVNAVLGGMRMNDVKDTIKRLLRVSEAPHELLDYVSAIFAHLSDIQYFRNRLTHYHTHAWFRKKGTFLNTDLEIVRERGKEVTFTFTYDALEAARHDLHAISDLMGQLFDPELESFALVLPTWQYKPSMLIR